MTSPLSLVFWFGDTSMIPRDGAFVYPFLLEITLLFCLHELCPHREAMIELIIQCIKTNSARPQNCRPTYAQSPPGSCTREGFVLLNREIFSNGRPLKIAHLFDLVKAFLRPFCRSRDAGLSSCFCGARPRGLCPCWVPGRSRPWRPPARRLCGPPRRGAFAPGLRAACVGRRPRRGPQKTRPAVAPPASPRLPACRPWAPFPVLQRVFTVRSALCSSWGYGPRTPRVCATRTSPYALPLRGA